MLGKPCVEVKGLVVTLICPSLWLWLWLFLWQKVCYFLEALVIIRSQVTRHFENLAYSPRSLLAICTLLCPCANKFVYACWVEYFLINLHIITSKYVAQGLQELLDKLVVLIIIGHVTRHIAMIAVSTNSDDRLFESICQKILVDIHTFHVSFLKLLITSTNACTSLWVKVNQHKPSSYNIHIGSS